MKLFWGVWKTHKTVPKFYYSPLSPFLLLLNLVISRWGEERAAQQTKACKIKQPEIEGSSHFIVSVLGSQTVMHESAEIFFFFPFMTQDMPYPVSTLRSKN